MKNIISISILLILSIQAISQNIVYVKNSATGQETGSSWNNAYRNLKSAIENAPENSEIWISIWTADSEAQTSSKEEYLTIDKPLKLYGGFFGTETNKNERSKSSYTRIGGKLENADFGYHAFRIKSQNVVLDRFQIRNFDSFFNVFSTISAE